MGYNFEKPNRKFIRLKGYDYSYNGAYFITLVTQGRINFFGEIIDGKMVLNDYGKIIEEEWFRTQVVRKNVILDEFVIMPNHIHGIIFIDNSKNEIKTPKKETFSNLKSNSLGSILGQIKSVSSKRINKVIGDLDNIGRVNYQLEQIEKESISNNKIIGDSDNIGRVNYQLTPTEKIHQDNKTIIDSNIIVGANWQLAQIEQTIKFKWQRNYYEHIIRNEKSLNIIRKYIQENPLKWHLDKENLKGEYKKYNFKNIQEINNFKI